MVSLLTPHHVQLVNACYPPSAALLTAAPDYKPNAQELSRLTYYASNRPSKITKLGNVLQKRIVGDVRKAQAANLRARAQLLISLNILKALLNECRRDISLLSAALMSSLDICLASLSNDLEISAKVATVFAAWTTYSTGHLLGVDMTLTKDYVSTLRHFANMAVIEARKNDLEDRNRLRLIGLAALAGTISSETLYNSSTQFKSQVSVVIPSLLSNLLQLELRTLEVEIENIKNNPVVQSPFVADGRSRPVVERRAASIHVHVTGESGPTEKDIANATLRALALLFGQSNVGQLGHVLQSLFDALGVQNAWGRGEHCSWLARKAVDWTQYQYRFAVPARMVERLSEAQGDSSSSDLHMTLATMIKAVFMSSTPLINLSTSDIMSSLTSLILHRVSLNPNDALLQVLVECVGALGTHIYYADQIHDLACELVSRITNIESMGVSGRGQVYTRKEEERAMALRCLASALAYLMERSHKHLQSTSSPKDDAGKGEILSDTASARSTSSKSPDAQATLPTLPRRTRVPPDVFQETLALLCDDHQEVRADYTNVLATFLRTEVAPERPPLIDGSESKNTVKRRRSSTDQQAQRIKTHRLATYESTVLDRFLHALHASLFILATSPRLGLPSTAQPSPTHSADDINSDHPLQVNVIPSTPMRNETSSALSESNQDTHTSQYSHSSRRRTLAGHKLMKLRKLLLLNQKSPSSSQESNSCASLHDFSRIVFILSTVQDQIPSRGLLQSIPMLIALNQWCKDGSTLDTNPSDDARPRQAVITELSARIWLKIADNWDCDGLRSMASSVISSTNSSIPAASEHHFPRCDRAEPLSEATHSDIKVSSFDSTSAITMLAMQRNVQVATGLDEEALRARLEAPWTAEESLNNSTERTPTNDSLKPNLQNPVLRIAPGLMHIENLSLQSLARSTRGVGVSDLRDALEGRVNMSNVVLPQHKAPSVSSLGTHTLASGDSSHATSPQLYQAHANRLRNRVANGGGERRTEVRDVLDKLGIGSKGGPNLFKASMANKQKGKGT